MSLLSQAMFNPAVTKSNSLTKIVGDPVWLSISTAGKLNPKWEGEWVIQFVQSPVTYTISDSQRTKTVHSNQLRPRLQAATDTTVVDQQPQQQT